MKERMVPALSPKARRYLLRLLDNAIEHLRINLAHEGDEDAISDISNDLGFVLSIKHTLETSKEDAMPSKVVPAQQLSDAGEDLVRLAAAKDAEIAALKEQHEDHHAMDRVLRGDIRKLTGLRRQNAEKADLLDRCIALFRKNGDYPTLTQEIVAALTSAPQVALDAETAPFLPETP